MLHALRGGRGGVESATLIDTSQGMLDRVKKELNSNKNGENTMGFPENVEYVLADAEKEMLPVDPGTFDVVISCLGLHWVNDVPVSNRKIDTAFLFLSFF